MVIVCSFLFSVLVIVVDQLTKFFIFGKISGSILGNFLWFESQMNTGIAFSMFENAGLVISILTLLASLLLAVVICIRQYFPSKAEKFLLGIILGGAVSNLIDRFMFGGVRDFIYLKFINFSIFNIADIAVTLGVIAFVIVYLVKGIKRSKKESKVGTKS